MICRCFDIHGIIVGIRASDPSLWRQLPDHLPQGWKQTRSKAARRSYTVSATRRCYFEVRTDSAVVAQADCVENALYALEYDLEQFMVANCPARVFLHAGVVGWNGQAIVIPGASFSGKSTLTAALCQAGGTYYSDEFAPIDSLGMIHPYPRPIHLRQSIPGAPPPRKSPAIAALPVGLVLLTQFQPGAHWNPECISPGRAVLDILSHTFASHHSPQTTLGWLHRSVRSAHIYHGLRGDANEVLQFVCAELSGSPLKGSPVEPPFRRTK